MNKAAVIRVNVTAFFINIFKPIAKLLGFKSYDNEIVCLNECRKQKYNVNATSGGKKKFKASIDQRSKTTINQFSKPLKIKYKFESKLKIKNKLM